MLEACNEGFWVQEKTEDDWTGEITYNEVWVQRCAWVAVSTFRDECMSCGRSNHYTNSNGYPEESLIRHEQK